MRARLLFIAIPGLAGVLWLSIAHGTAASSEAHDAAAAVGRADLIRSLLDLSARQRSLRVELALADTTSGAVEPDEAATRSVADATNALQRRADAVSSVLTPPERIALTELGVSLGEWADQVEQGTAPVAAADEVAESIRDLIAMVSSSPASGRWAGRLAAIDRFERAAAADLDVYLTAIDALGREATQRNGVARAVTSARRRAAATLADAAASSDAEARSSLERLASGGDAQLLAAFGDDETVKTLSVPPAEIADRAADRTAAWTKIVDVEARRVRAAVVRDRTSLATAERSAWALGSTWVLLGLGISLILASRLAAQLTRDESESEPRRDGGARGETPAAAVPATPEPAPELPPIETPVASEPEPERAGAVLDCLVEYARDQRASLSEQIDLLERAQIGRAPGATGELMDAFERSIIRTRRLTESVLVLAGAEANRAELADCSLGEVMAAAVDEVGSPHAVTMPRIGSRAVRGAAVVDVAHLLAELLDLSAVAGVEGPVHVKVSEPHAEGVVVTMEHDLADGPTIATDVLQRALDGGWVPGGMGWMAAGELARRHDIGVSVDPASGARTVRVAVVLGAGVVSDRAGGSIAKQEEHMVWGWTATGEYLPATGWRADGEFVAAPPRLEDAVPSGAAFDAGVASLLENRTTTTASPTREG